MVQTVKNLPATWETQVQSLGQEDPWLLTPVFLPGEFPCQRRLAGYSPWGSQRVRHNLTDSHTQSKCRKKSHPEKNQLFFFNSVSRISKACIIWILKLDKGLTQEHYRPIFLTNTDPKLVNKFLVNWIQKCIKIINMMTKWVLYCECKVVSLFGKSK